MYFRPRISTPDSPQSSDELTTSIHYLADPEKLVRREGLIRRYNKGDRFLIPGAVEVEAVAASLPDGSLNVRVRKDVSWPPRIINLKPEELPCSSS